MNYSRRDFIKHFSILAASPYLVSCSSKAFLREDIKAFCIDFNWGPGGPNAFSKSGLWADANPEEHIRWYSELGCNVVQTFAVSHNGWAWYRSGVAPEQPGLKHDFLTDMVKLGHKKRMKVFGYFCPSANTYWGLKYPEESYGIPADYHIPYTNKYLDYLSASIEDALIKTGMDGFMVDWLWNPRKNEWIECEQEMYVELMEEKFPGKEQVSQKQTDEFRRRALNRCWKRIYETVQRVNPDCLVWLSCNSIYDKDLIGSPVFKEIDWLMNEAGDLESVKSVEPIIGDKTRLMTCLANWNNQDPVKVAPEAIAEGIGLYGFAAPTVGDLLPSVQSFLSQPISSFRGNDKIIATFARVYNGLSLDYISK
ncbi:hypothetical protein [Massilibacteroides sp.]|uniref:hypothetical protein n=1 Tax=Massilibacteroides sp. TaxID=2034766 RepID=UPI0026110852|nr:hypothetical protein [Massilibacteroides sp.]MDD4516247.1 hypothetical protein [Massilibacteroides sp.]